MTVGERIKERRLALNMTQDELAQKLGYTSRSSINKIEVDAQGLPQSKIQDIAKILDVSPSYLMGWENKESDSLEVTVSNMKLSSFEEKLIEAYRDADELTKKMVHRNLGLDEEFEKENLRKNFA